MLRNRGGIVWSFRISFRVSGSLEGFWSLSFCAEWLEDESLRARHPSTQKQSSAVSTNRERTLTGLPSL